MKKNTKTTALAKWDEELAKHATEVADKEQMPTGQFVSIKGGILSVAGQPMKDNKVQVVIIDHVYENAHYAGAFDPDSPQPPVCYAFGREEEELKPHEKASEPKHEQCSGCPLNVFGSAEKGKGKACKNTRRLALISADKLTAQSAEEGQLVYMKLPVTSTKGWAYFVKGLAATLRRPPFGVITEIAVVPDPKTQFKVTFSAVGPVPDEVMGAIMARREKVQGEIMFPYGTPSEVTEKPAKKGKAKASKF
jgi:hypothetical protein